MTKTPATHAAPNVPTGLPHGKSTGKATEFPDFTDFGTTLEAALCATNEADAIDRIQILENVKAYCSAAQVKETMALQKHRIANEKARGVKAADRGKGLATEIGLARRQSASRGTKYLKMAQALDSDLPKTYAALQTGKISEEEADIVATETAWLQPEDRQEIDDIISYRFNEGLGPRQLASTIRSHAQRIDHKATKQRYDDAVEQRNVFIRTTGDGTAYLMAHLPTHQAVAVHSTLHRAADRIIAERKTGDKKPENEPARTKNQIAADLLVQQLTGQTDATGAPAVTAHVHVVMTDKTLFGDENTPARIIGNGPMPAAATKEWLADPEITVFLRRVYTAPQSNQLVALESRSRKFPAGLRLKILLRDDTCRSPYCDAAIQDTDHATPDRDGGKTGWHNGSGLCKACNQTKENRGWAHTTSQEQLTVKTPTGHHYIKKTNDLIPGMPPPKNPDPG